MKKLELAIQDGAIERIEAFKDIRNHQMLTVHKLHGEMEGRYSFSVNYKIRIVYTWSQDKKTAFLIDIGDHTIYD